MTPRHTSRLLLPQINFLLRPSSRAIFPPHIRNASTPAKGLSEEFRRRQANKQPKPIPVIPQPDKYRPPSHGKRLPNRDLENRVYGPPLTEEDKKRMATKKYPNMMAPKGTFMHWFLHNRYIHVWISMSIIVSLSFTIWYVEFKHKTKLWHLMPEPMDYFWHPFKSIKQLFFVVSTHTNQMSEQTYYQRLKKTQDVERRKEFRFEREREAEERGEEFVYDSRYWVGEDGIRRRRVKRWFGIWE